MSNVLPSAGGVHQSKVLILEGGDSHNVKVNSRSNIVSIWFFLQSMNDKEKKKFQEYAEEDKARYKREMANYKPPSGGKGGKGGKRRKKDPDAPKRNL